VWFDVLSFASLASAVELCLNPSSYWVWFDVAYGTREDVEELLRILSQSQLLLGVVRCHMGQRNTINEGTCSLNPSSYWVWFDEIGRYGNKFRVDILSQSQLLLGVVR
jgi:hypothetical protein